MVKLGKFFGKSKQTLSPTKSNKSFKLGTSPQAVPAPVPVPVPVPAPVSVPVSDAPSSEDSLKKLLAEDAPFPQIDEVALGPNPDDRNDIVDVDKSFTEEDEERSGVSGTYDGTHETDYEEDDDEELSNGEEEEATTDEEHSLDETYDETHDETPRAGYSRTSRGSNKRGCSSSSSTAKGNDPSKKYFHKDVVLNSLDEGMDSLVIRAMYFVPRPKAEDHVVVKIEASTVTDRDTMMCKGYGVSRRQLPFVPGHEFIGTIQSTGRKSASQFREGDRVAGVSATGGGTSRFISITASRLTKIPANVKSTHAVCMLHDYMAGLKALRLAKNAYSPGSPFTGMNILVTDGFSPVGQAIIALAQMEGATIYSCADECNHSYLDSIGVKCFAKNPGEWLPTAAGTFDVVIDNSCLDSYTSSWFALTQKGNLVCLGPIFKMDDDHNTVGCGLVGIHELQQKWAGLKAKYVMTQTSFFNTITDYDDDRNQYKQDLRYLMFLLEKGDITPKIAEKVSLDDVPDAQRLISQGRANGTMVCIPWIE